MATTTETCYRHPNRETAVHCSNCGRPICPECMTSTPVGMRCPECARQKTQVRTMRDISTPAVPVTIALIALNVLLWIPQGNLGLFSGGGFNAYGARLALYGPSVADGEWWRLVTGGFQHASILHIGFNMYLLWLLGQSLEPRLGRVRFGLLYAASLLGGSLGALLLDPNQPTIGASGAVFGLMGAAYIAQRDRGIDPYVGSVGGLIAFNLVLGFVIPNVSVGGHIGGLIAGGLVALVLQQVDRRRVPEWATYVAPVVVGALAVAGSLWAAGQPTGLF